MSIKWNGWKVKLGRLKVNMQTEGSNPKFCQIFKSILFHQKYFFTSIKLSDAYNPLTKMKLMLCNNHLTFLSMACNFNIFLENVHNSNLYPPIVSRNHPRNLKNLISNFRVKWSINEIKNE